MTRFVVTGTDTGIGKTIFAAALAGATGAPYWKPIQAGLDDETDSETVARLLPVAQRWGGGPPRSGGGGATTVPESPSVSPADCHLPIAAQQGGNILPEAYRLVTAASPHIAAEIDGVTIDLDRLTPPPGDLIVEGAGGALAPVTRTTLYADIFARWQIPVIVCARTALGTINHSLLTIEALRARGVPIHGLAFLGDAVEDSEAIIAAIGGVRRLGRLPLVDPLTPENLAAAFNANFDLTDFQ
ncbi:ATP-dependent dethiobiotin synthetase BioD [Sphingopyxis sp. EG6]|uniref:ATP-dependent dethiobiotin synthetase BioD n=1 Tax=Sphingopyxis sp. EG6 TaxID=1874061 RepID=UPI000DC62AEF|nr:ATP-dependent dethiobiotin synthetase BioD [Sphingopyxis sp. EG6]BBB07954.1 dithiobiotin synthetase [Sphingopyxis sp. EG6]